MRIGVINHAYPYCWRSDTPLIYRAIAGTFINVLTLTLTLTLTPTLSLAPTLSLTPTPTLTLTPGTFINVEAIKDRLIANNEKTYWVPDLVSP